MALLERPGLREPFAGFSKYSRTGMGAHWKIGPHVGLPHLVLYGDLGKPAGMQEASGVLDLTNYTS